MNIITEAGKYNAPNPVGDEVWIRPVRVDIDPVSSLGDFSPGLVRQLKEAGILTSIRWPDRDGGLWYPIRFKADQHPYIDLTEASQQSFTFNEARDFGMRVQGVVTKALDRALNFQRLFTALDKNGQVSGLSDLRGQLEGLLAEVKDVRGIPARLAAVESWEKYFKERIDNLDRLITGNSDVDFGARISMLGRRCGKLEPQMEEALRAIAFLTERVEALWLQAHPPVEVPPRKPRSRKPRVA